MGLGIDSQSQQRFSKYSDFFFKWSLSVTPWSWRRDFHAATAPWWLHSSLSADIRWIQNRNLKGESLHALLPNLLIHSYSLTPRIRPSLLNPPGHGRLLSSTERGEELFMKVKVRNTGKRKWVLYVKLYRSFTDDLGLPFWKLCGVYINLKVLFSFSSILLLLFARSGYWYEHQGP